MTDSKFVEKPLLEKIQDLLDRKPGTCDVAFCVGKEKKVVRALKVILKASSPILEKEFEEKWEVAVVNEGDGNDGIPLPDFDPIAFEMFVKLTSLDTWSLELLEQLSLSPNQILNLLFVCRRFEMKKAVENLEKATTFLRSFADYKDTDDFLELSQINLKSVLDSDEIGVKELDVFYSAMRWAEFQCKQMMVEPTKERIREVLGDCLFEIRFPVMTCAEFTEARESKDILTAEEIIEIYGFIGLADSQNLKFDTTKLLFKTRQRNQVQSLELKPNSKIVSGSDGRAIYPPGISTLCLILGSEIVENPPFVCDGSFQYHYFACEKKVTIYGLGFVGPIEKDEFYDAKVQILGACGIEYDSGMLEKRILAAKGKYFYFVFDAPIDLEAGAVSGNWTKFYEINYFLKGANTSSCSRALFTNFNLQKKGSKFRFYWGSNQVVEILFKLR